MHEWVLYSEREPRRSALHEWCVHESKRRSRFALFLSLSLVPAWLTDWKLHLEFTESTIVKINKHARRSAPTLSRVILIFFFSRSDRASGTIWVGFPPIYANTGNKISPANYLCRFTIFTIGFDVIYWGARREGKVCVCVFFLNKRKKYYVIEFDYGYSR